MGPLTRKLKTTPKASEALPSADVEIQEESHAKDNPGSTLIRKGVVVSWHPGSWTAMVKIDTEGSVEPAHWAVGSVFSSLFGLRTSFHPEPGTSVLVLKAPNIEENYILTTLPHPTGSLSERKDAGTDKTVLDSTAGQALKGNGQEQRGDALNHKDRAFGEFDLENGYGIGVQFLQNLCRLRASERAMIEVHMMDDLVRLVSDNFQHINAFGDFEIFNDGGRPTVKWKGSSKEYETLGKDSPLGEGVGDPDDPFETGAKTRFESYLGHLGNIFHMFVAEPAESVGAVAAGRFRAHVNEDGSFLLQSVADIIFEKAVIVQVPAEKFTADDPAGDKLQDLEYEPHPSLKTWIAEDEDNLYYESYKLRDYARWMNNWFSLAQFHRSKKDYTVPTESSAPESTPDNGGDKERPNAGYDSQHALYIQSYATIRIFRDGTILNMDGYGSTIHMAGGDVTVSASRHLRLEAAGDIIMTAGRDIITKAYRHFDLAAIKGGITLRAETWWRALANTGAMLLEGKAKPDDEGAEKGSVIIRAALGDLNLVAGRNTILQSTGAVIINSMRGLLARVSSVLFKNSNNIDIFGVSSNGEVTAKQSIITENQVYCSQVMVTSPRPIPTPGGGKIESAVLPPTNPRSVDDGMATAAGPLSAALDVLAAGEFEYALDAPGFTHHNEFDDDKLLRSITQSLLQNDAPPQLVFAYKSDFTANNLKLNTKSGAIGPGDSGKEKIAKSENPPMHTPSNKNNQSNRGKGLTEEGWKFTRLDT